MNVISPMHGVDMRNCPARCALTRGNRRWIDIGPACAPVTILTHGANAHKDIVPRSPPPTLVPDVNALTHLHASLCVCLDLSFPGPVATCFILIHHSVSWSGTQKHEGREFDLAPLSHQTFVSTAAELNAMCALASWHGSPQGNFSAETLMHCARLRGVEGNVLLNPLTLLTMHAGLVHRSDHWWAIVRRGQSWVTLDSFKGTEVRPDGAAYIRKIMAPGPRREEPPAIIAPSTQGSTPIKSTAPRHASSPKYRKTANHDWPRHYAWNSTMFREPTFRNKLLKHLRHMTQTDPHPQKITDATCFNQKGVIYVIVDLAKRKFYVDTLYTGRNHNDKFRRAATPREIYWIQRMKSGIPDGYNVAFSHRYARSRRAPRAPKRMRDPGPHQRQSGPVFTVSDDSTQISLEPGENVKLRHRLNVLLKMTDKTKRGNLLGTWKPRTIAGTLRWIQEHIPIVQRAKDVAILEDQLHAHIEQDTPAAFEKWKEAVMTRCRKNYSGSARTQEQPTYSDKAAHDLAICCRQWYLQKLRDELLNARVYQQSREAKEEIIVRHRAKAEEFQSYCGMDGDRFGAPPPTAESPLTSALMRVSGLRTLILSLAFGPHLSFLIGSNRSSMDTATEAAALDALPALTSLHTGRVCISAPTSSLSPSHVFITPRLYHPHLHVSAQSIVNRCPRLRDLSVLNCSDEEFILTPHDPASRSLVTLNLFGTKLRRVSINMEPAAAAAATATTTTTTAPGVLPLATSTSTASAVSSSSAAPAAPATLRHLNLSSCVKLKSLELRGLPRLTTISLRRCLRLGSRKDVMIYGCPALRLVWVASACETAQFAKWRALPGWEPTALSTKPNPGKHLNCCTVLYEAASMPQMHQWRHYRSRKEIQDDETKELTMTKLLVRPRFGGSCFLDAVPANAKEAVILEQAMDSPIGTHTLASLTKASSAKEPFDRVASKLRDLADSQLLPSRSLLLTRRLLPRWWDLAERHEHGAVRNLVGILLSGAAEYTKDTVDNGVEPMGPAQAVPEVRLVASEILARMPKPRARVAAAEAVEAVAEAVEAEEAASCRPQAGAAECAKMGRREELLSRLSDEWSRRWAALVPPEKRCILLDGPVENSVLIPPEFFGVSDKVAVIPSMAASMLGPNAWSLNQFARRVLQQVMCDIRVNQEVPKRLPNPAPFDAAISTGGKKKKKSPSPTDEKKKCPKEERPDLLAGALLWEIFFELESDDFGHSFPALLKKAAKLYLINRTAVTVAPGSPFGGLATSTDPGFHPADLATSTAPDLLARPATAAAAPDLLARPATAAAAPAPPLDQPNPDVLRCLLARKDGPALFLAHLPDLPTAVCFRVAFHLVDFARYAMYPQILRFGACLQAFDLAPAELTALATGLRQLRSEFPADLIVGVDELKPRNFSSSPKSDQYCRAIQTIANAHGRGKVDPADKYPCEQFFSSLYVLLEVGALCLEWAAASMKKPFAHEAPPPEVVTYPAVGNLVTLSNLITFANHVLLQHPHVPRDKDPDSHTFRGRYVSPDWVMVDGMALELCAWIVCPPRPPRTPRLDDKSAATPEPGTPKPKSPPKPESSKAGTKPKSPPKPSAPAPTATKRSRTQSPEPQAGAVAAAQCAPESSGPVSLSPSVLPEPIYPYSPLQTLAGPPSTCSSGGYLSPDDLTRGSLPNPPLGPLLPKPLPGGATLWKGFSPEKAPLGVVIQLVTKKNDQPAEVRAILVRPVVNPRGQLQLAFVQQLNLARRCDFRLFFLMYWQILAERPIPPPVSVSPALAAPSSPSRSPEGSHSSESDHDEEKHTPPSGRGGRGGLADKRRPPPPLGAADKDGDESTASPEALLAWVYGGDAEAAQRDLAACQARLMLPADHPLAAASPATISRLLGLVRGLFVDDRASAHRLVERFFGRAGWRGFWGAHEAGVPPTLADAELCVLPAVTAHAAPMLPVGQPPMPASRP
ncbi:hypothetical protein PAPYR_7907 [Paratrimastix pyriformis]|uniref:USP domain-containing protein n=1 Tax=Paratrimastix pyriformis TaxID=342808 RepID=A0ABQ8UIY8_9EUKA|nr:hypothetical protein PAPYR_7907 [Paratrimastix pyriformis]